MNLSSGCRVNRNGSSTSTACSARCAVASSCRAGNRAFRAAASPPSIGTSPKGVRRYAFAHHGKCSTHTGVIRTQHDAALRNFHALKYGSRHMPGIHISRMRRDAPQSAHWVWLRCMRLREIAAHFGAQVTRIARIEPPRNRRMTEDCSSHGRSFSTRRLMRKSEEKVFAEERRFSAALKHVPSAGLLAPAVHAMTRRVLRAAHDKPPRSLPGSGSRRVP